MEPALAENSGILFNEEGKSTLLFIFYAFLLVSDHAKKSDKEGQANSPAILLRLRPHLLVHEEERQREPSEFIGYLCYALLLIFGRANKITRQTNLFAICFAFLLKIGRFLARGNLSSANLRPAGLHSANLGSVDRGATNLGPPNLG